MIFIKGIHKLIILMMVMIFGLNICFAELPSFAVVNDKNTKNASSSRAIASAGAVSEKVLVANSPMFNFQAKGVVLMEPKSGKVIYMQNEHERVYPASTTKIMTMLLLMEAIDQGKIKMDDMVTVSEYASTMGGSQIWAKPGEKFTVQEALKAICIASANDMCIVISEAIAGSVDNFVSMMNQEAKRIGMNDTKFMNPHGLDDPEHYTSAYDMSLLSKEIIVRYPQILDYTSIWMDSLRDGQFGLNSTNKLLKSYSGANGLKTGSTSIAMYSICASSVRNDMSLIAIIMSAPNSDTRFNEAKQLLDYGFTNFKSEELNKEEKYGTIKVDKGKQDEIDIWYEKNTGTVLEKGSSAKIEKVIDVPTKITAPISQGQVIGTVNYMIGDVVIEKANIVSNTAVNKANILDNIKKMFDNIVIKNR